MNSLISVHGHVNCQPVQILNTSVKADTAT